MYKTTLKKRFVKAPKIFNACINNKIEGFFIGETPEFCHTGIDLSDYPNTVHEIGYLRRYDNSENFLNGMSFHKTLSVEERTFDTLLDVCLYHDDFIANNNTEFVPDGFWVSAEDGLERDPDIFEAPDFFEEFSKKSKITFYSMGHPKQVDYYKKEEQNQGYIYYELCIEEV